MNQISVKLDASSSLVTSTPNHEDKEYLHNAAQEIKT
jgi:hypothetical protein